DGGGWPAVPGRRPPHCSRRSGCPGATKTAHPSDPPQEPPGADADRAWAPVGCNRPPPPPVGRPHAAGPWNPNPACSPPCGWADAQCTNATTDESNAGSPPPNRSPQKNVKG